MFTSPACFRYHSPMENRGESSLAKSLANIPSPEETLDITGALGDPTRYAIYRAIVDGEATP